MESDGTPRQYFVGLNQSKKQIKNNTAEKVFLAKDADLKIKAQIQTLCQIQRVSCDTSYTKEEIGRMCNIDVPCAVCVKAK